MVELQEEDLAPELEAWRWEILMTDHEELAFALGRPLRKKYQRYEPEIPACITICQGGEYCTDYCEYRNNQVLFWG